MARPRRFRMDDGSIVEQAPKVAPTATPTSTASPELKALSIANSPRPNTQIPVSTMETAVQPVPLPTPDANPTDMIGGAVGLAQSFAEEQKQALANAEAPVSQSEAEIRRLMGLQAGEAGTRADLEDQFNIDQKTKAYNDIVSRIQRQTSQIQQFDDEAFFNVEEARLDAGGRDITKGVFGAKEAQMNLQRAIQRRAEVSELQGSIASAALLKGDLELATQQVDKALAAIYDPIKQSLQNEMFFLERNDKRFDAAQKEASEARKMVLQTQLDSISRAEGFVMEAVASGFATPEEVRQLNALSGNPQAQANAAQEILGRGTAQQRAIENAYRSAQIDEIYNRMDRSVIEDFQDMQKAQQRTNNQVASAEVVLDKVTDALDQVGKTTSGLIGGLSQKVPGSKAYDLARTIDTIKANLGFDALQAMREASPTGGALGQVAVQELAMLQATVSSLAVGQSEDQLRTNLNDVFTHYANWLNTVGYEVAPDGTVIQITN